MTLKIKDRNQEWLLEKKEIETTTRSSSSYQGADESSLQNDEKYESEELAAVGAGDDSTTGGAESDPEWFSDGIPILNDKEHEMTFDEDGQYVLAKDLSDNDDDYQKQRSTKPFSSSTEFQSTNQPNSSKSNTNAIGTEQGIAKTSSSYEILAQNQSNLGLCLNSLSKNMSAASFGNFNQAHTAAQKNAANSIQNQNFDPMLESSSMMMNPKLGAVSMDHPDAEKWFYLDPQNNVQGPFSNEQMAVWCAAGYFTLNLMMKRGSDPKFVPFGKKKIRLFDLNKSMFKTFCLIKKCFILLGIF